MTDSSEPQLFTRENIRELEWPLSPDGEYARQYLLPIIQDGPQKYFRNVHNTQLMVAKVGEVVLPITVTDFHSENSYTCSPYSHYVLYGGLEEVRHLNKPLLEGFVRLVMKPVGWYFRRAELDRVVFVNNYLLSTNLYPSLTAEQVHLLCEALPRWFPERVIVFRSVDERGNPNIKSALEKNGCELVLSRQVWYMQPEESIRTRQVRLDEKELRNHGYEVARNEALSDDDLHRAVQLYKMLYLEKYSYFNPQLTFEYLKLARDSEILHLRALRRNGTINAVMGFFIRNGIMTQPLFGYDTALPQAEGLYRLLTLVTLREGLQSNLLVHASGGVGKFKKIRGAKSVIEYNAVYHRHLPAWRARPWRLIQSLSQFMIPYFQKNDF
jgi:hypothetical protein